MPATHPQLRRGRDRRAASSPGCATATSWCTTRTTRSPPACSASSSRPPPTRNVLAIKQTLYRTSGDSPIVDALIDAAEAGKQVVVLVEVKARFDEKANIGWARTLERAGCHVVYGLVGLKTHCKTALVVRQEGNQIRRYCHVGTGNYHPKTARHVRGLRPAHRRPGGRRRPDRPVQRADRVQPADRLPAAAGGAARRPRAASSSGSSARPRRPAGRPALVQIKVNSLVDEEIIDALYRASQAGVRVDLIVRGICALRPGRAGAVGQHPGALDRGPVPGALAGVPVRQRRATQRVLDRLGRPDAPQPRPPGRGAGPGHRPGRPGRAGPVAGADR